LLLLEALAAMRFHPLGIVALQGLADDLYSNSDCAHLGFVWGEQLKIVILARKNYQFANHTVG